MRSTVMILWGILWTLLFSVSAHAFGWTSVACHIPIVMAVHGSTHQSKLQTYVVVFVLAWLEALLSGGARGPVMLSHLIITAILLATRGQWRVLHLSQFFLVTIAASMAWSLCFVLIMAIMSPHSWWSSLLFASPISAALTGVFALFHYVVMNRGEPSPHLNLATRRTTRL